MSFDDLWRLRISRDGFRAPSSGQSANGAPAMIGQVTTSSPMVGTFCLVNPVSPFGPEVEGGAGTFTPRDPAARIAVYLLGPAAPATGDYLICKHVDHRWVAERSHAGSGTGGGFGSIPNCFCNTSPGTLTMTSADPSCNGGMFQSCTIVWGPTPTVYLPLNLGTNSYLSTTSFPDSTADGARFVYYLTCQYNQWNLARVYIDSPYGSPYRDIVLYSWLIGGSGNTCDPFVLGNGTAYPGSDPSCSVTIEG